MTARRETDGYPTNENAPGCGSRGRLLGRVCPLWGDDRELVTLRHSHVVTRRAAGSTKTTLHLAWRPARWLVDSTVLAMSEKVK